MRRLLASCTAFLVAAAIAHAQANPFVGSWQASGTFNGVTITFELVMGADQRYSELQQSAVGTTQQTGVYRVQDGTLAFDVIDWQPKWFKQQPVAKPGGGIFRYQFAGPNSFTVQDINLGGVLTYVRTQ
jgi:hypothetical protein